MVTVSDLDDEQLKAELHNWNPASDDIDLLALLGVTGQDDDLEWQERALCAQTDPEAFFPEKGGSTREAKRICLGCEVRAECLEYALTHSERFGIWGGLSERERRKLTREAPDPTVYWWDTQVAARHLGIDIDRHSGAPAALRELGLVPTGPADNLRWDPEQVQVLVEQRAAEEVA